MDVIPDDCWSCIIKAADERTATTMTRVCRRMRRLVAKVPRKLYFRVEAVLYPISPRIMLAFDKELDFVQAHSNGCRISSLRVISYMLGRTIAPSDFGCSIWTAPTLVTLNDGTLHFIDRERYYTLAKLLEILVNHKFRANRICAQMLRDALTPGAEMVLEKALRSKQWRHVGPVAKCMGEKKIYEQWVDRLRALQLDQEKTKEQRSALSHMKRK